MSRGPAREAVVRGFLALVLDMVRVDPERRPNAEMVRWYRELALGTGLAPAEVGTNRELLDEALRVARAVQESKTAA
ncbi:MAG: hypothetical protein RIB67_05420 [Miltoncostaeaceae bacterium]